MVIPQADLILLGRNRIALTIHRNNADRVLTHDDIGTLRIEHVSIAYGNRITSGTGFPRVKGVAPDIVGPSADGRRCEAQTKCVHSRIEQSPRCGAGRCGRKDSWRAVALRHLPFYAAYNSGFRQSQ
jgi:hypothetical protein